MNCRCGNVMQILGSLQNGYYFFCKKCNKIHPINNEDVKKYKK